MSDARRRAVLRTMRRVERDNSIERLARKKEELEHLFSTLQQNRNSLLRLEEEKCGLPRETVLKASTIEAGDLYCSELRKKKVTLLSEIESMESKLDSLKLELERLSLEAVNAIKALELLR